MISARWPSFAAMVVLVGACDQASAPSPVATPAFKVGQAPPAAGPVVRFEGHYITYLTDVNANLTVSVGTPSLLAEVCSPADIDVAPVTPDSGSIRRARCTRSISDRTCRSWCTRAGTNQFDVCNDLAGAPVIATGTAHMVYLGGSTGRRAGATFVGAGQLRVSSRYAAGGSGLFNANERIPGRSERSRPARRGDRPPPSRLRLRRQGPSSLAIKAAPARWSSPCEASPSSPAWPSSAPRRQGGEGNWLGWTRRSLDILQHLDVRGILVADPSAWWQ